MRTPKTILSGIQPSGLLTLGNYLGALRNWEKIQNAHDCSFFVADMHAITVRQDPEVLRKNTRMAVLQYLACGIDPDINTIFVQSHVSEHAELAWILNCCTNMGELSRMTQFKDKSKKQEHVGVGLFDYPVLMAADILLYDTDYVPVGADQTQHLELARTIARRFNTNYGQDIFKIPEPFVSDTGARIMSLQDPERKMSKSDPNPNGYISLLDPRDAIIKKFRKAKTDSLGIVRYSEDQPGISNLINIYASVTGKNIHEVEREFEGKGYGYFKPAVAETVADVLRGIQQRYQELDSSDNDQFLKDLYRRGAEAAHETAKRKLDLVKQTVGFVGRP